MRKYQKQKIISNLYYNIVIFSFIASSANIMHHASTDTAYLNLINNISLVKDQENIPDMLERVLFIEKSNVDEELSNNQNLPSLSIRESELEKIIFHNDTNSQLILVSECVSEYSGMALSHELENNLKILANGFHIPYQILLTIGYQESGGNWNNNGIISSTDDYGLFQINQCNFSYIEEQLGYSKEEILNDELKNAEACLLLLSNILKREDVTTLEDIFGMYNGWVNWQNKSQSVNYVDSCMEIMGTYFPSYEYQKVMTIK